MAQAYAHDLQQEIPEIDAFVGLDDLDRVVAAARGELEGQIPDQRESVRLYDHLHPRLLSTGGYAYLKVAEGCDNPCTFCHIPAMRGRFRSRMIPDLVAEALSLQVSGIRELVLVAQDTTRYGEDLGLAHGLRELIEALLEETSIPWIRFLYAYPATLDEGLFHIMRRNQRFIPYLDIPLQHVSRRVLKAMKRGGDDRSYAALIERARELVPEITLRTTFITGFPGEGEREFDELLEFVASTRFDHVGVFSYSWQEENPGAELGDPINEEVKQLRRSELLQLQQSISLERNESLVGYTLPALVAGALPEMELLTEARLRRQAPEIDGRLLINDGIAPPGSIVDVEVTEAHPYDVVGRVVSIVSPGSGVGERLPVRG
jgi:ribosomal protein S12 methylthiotransferase